MKNSQKGFTLALIIAIVAVLMIGGGVYYYLKAKNSPLSITKIEGWKTYTNEKYGYSFQYPDN